MNWKVIQSDPDVLHLSHAYDPNARGEPGYGGPQREEVRFDRTGEVYELTVSDGDAGARGAHRVRGTAELDGAAARMICRWLADPEDVAT